MQITKFFEVESSHIVRNCTSERCSHSIHGHSAKIEVTFESRQLDNAQMVMDFGLMKGSIKQFIDTMDHCYLLCANDDEDFKNFIKKTCARWIELSFNPSAEMLSVFIMSNVQNILNHTQFNNGESQQIKVSSVRYWETRTGSATCDVEDMIIYNALQYNDKIVYSDQVLKELGDAVLSEVITNQESTVKLINPTIEQQIKLD